MEVVFILQYIHNITVIFVIASDYYLFDNESVIPHRDLFESGLAPQHVPEPNSIV